MKDRPAALKSARLWVELAPNSLQARQALAHLLLQEADLAGTRQQLNALMEIAQARGDDGFLLAAAVLGGEHRTTHGVSLLTELADAKPGDARASTQSRSCTPASRPTPRRSRGCSGRSSSTQLVQAAAAARPGARGHRPDAAGAGGAEGGGGHAAGRRRAALGYAKLLVESKDYAAALAEYRKLRRKAPKDVEILLTTGLVAMQAEDCRRRATPGRPDRDREHNDEARYFLAQTEELADRPDAAMDLYRQVIDGRSGSTPGRVWRCSPRTRARRRGRERLAQLRVVAPTGQWTCTSRRQSCCASTARRKKSASSTTRP